MGLFTADRQGLIGGNVRLLPTNSSGSPLSQGEKQEKDKGNRFDFGLQLENNYLIIGDHPEYYPDTFAFNTLALEKSKTFEHRFFLKPKPKPAPKPAFDTIEIRQAIVLENILYDFNQSNIRPESEPDLSVVKGLMDDYPNMIIELSSHTDARGKDDYNRTLSKRRADAARRWLIDKGVNGDRIKTEGYGETVPQTVSERSAERFNWLKPGQVLTEDYINALPTEQQEATHELNRRTEFKILEGPTSIIIKREILEKKPNPAPKRNANPGNSSLHGPQSSGKRVNHSDSLVVNELSSLYGQKELNDLPILQFSERKIDLGNVTPGEKRSFTVSFTNLGSAPAKIMLIQACDCTTVTHDNAKVYAPGQSGLLEVVFDSHDKTEAETISIDIFLEQTDHRNVPIVEAVMYSFGLGE
ncbi:MAG: OmpA family protein [Lewinella sp.]|nr:OmpA family protein [Lewinella sp.]